VTLDCVTGFMRSKGAVHQIVGCVPWAMRGLDPAVGQHRVGYSRNAFRTAETSIQAGACTSCCGCCRAGLAWAMRGASGWFAYR
jgi:hypothetical protein